MFPDKFVTSLVTMALKNPKVATVVVLLLVSGTLGSAVKFLFLRNDQIQESVSQDKSTEIRELKGSVASLQGDNDSLRSLIGDIRTDCLKREIEGKDRANADLKTLADNLRKEKEEMARKLNALQVTANRAVKASENLNSQKP